MVVPPSMAKVLIMGNNSSQLELARAVTTGADVIKGQLHEVDYAVRLMQFLQI
jgi:hypothetical protein